MSKYTDFYVGLFTRMQQSEKRHGISEDTDAWIATVSRENAAQAVNDERCVPVIPCLDEPAHTENNGYWCDDPSCPCRQERSYCERYVKVEVS